MLFFCFYDVWSIFRNAGLHFEIDHTSFCCVEVAQKEVLSSSASPNAVANSVTPLSLSRSCLIGISAASYNFHTANPEERKAQRRADIDRAIDRVRAKYDYFSIRRAITLIDPALDLDDHIIHPVGFLGTL